MTTKRHARYLKNYPEKIALKRRNRREHVRRMKIQDRIIRSGFHTILSKYLASKKQAGTHTETKSWGSKVKNLFKRKPSV